MRPDGSRDPADRRRRLFVALELPGSVRTAIGAWTASELTTIGTLRPVRVDGLHVTLCFLGSMAVGEIEPIGDRCRAVCAGHRALHLSIGDLLALPRRRPRAIAVRVGDERRGQLSELQRDDRRRVGG